MRESEREGEIEYALCISHLLFYLDAGERTDSSFLQDDYVHGYIRNDAGVDKAADNYEVVTADIDADISGFPLSNGLEQYTDTMSQV